MSKGYLLMALFSATVAIISLLSLGYIFKTQPEYLRSDRDGVSYFTAQVIQPETGKAISMSELIRHFKGE